MSCTIIIRDYKKEDGPYVSEVVRNAYLSNVNSSWFNALTREITFQLIVMSAAILFIFVGIPLLYCIFVIPFVLLILYVAIYTSFLLKVTELVHSKKAVHCWVAEVYEPFISLEVPKNISYNIYTYSGAVAGGFQNGTYKRKIIGTVSLGRHLNDEDSTWLFRLAVDVRYQRKGVGRALIYAAQNWCRVQHYNSIELVMSECQESARQLFVDTGFEIHQLYHKRQFGHIWSLLMYQFSCDLRRYKSHFNY